MNMMLCIKSTPLYIICFELLLCDSVYKRNMYKMVYSTIFRKIKIKFSLKYPGFITYNTNEEVP